MGLTGKLEPQDAQAMICAAFRKQGLEPMEPCEDGYWRVADDTHPEGIPGLAFNMDNFVAKLQDATSGDREATLASLLRTIQAMRERANGKDMTPSLTELVPRVTRNVEEVPESYLPTEAEIVTRQYGPFEVALAAEGADMFAFVPKQVAKRAFPDQTSEQLLHQAVENLRLQKPRCEKLEDEDDTRIYVLTCGDGSNNSALIYLLRETFGAEWPLHGVVFAVPFQETLIAVPLNLQGMGLEVLYSFIREKIGGSARRALSGGFYWSDGIQPPEPFGLGLKLLPGARIVLANPGPRALAALQQVNSPDLN